MSTHNHLSSKRQASPQKRLQTIIASNDSIWTSVSVTANQLIRSHSSAFTALPNVPTFPIPTPVRKFPPNSYQCISNGKESESQNSGTQQLESKAVSTSADVGITCCLMTDVDQAFFNLSSGLHSVVAKAKEPFIFDVNENHFMPCNHSETLEDGFAMLDYFARKMVSLVLLLPHFEKIDRMVVTELIEERLIGATLIFSCLYLNLPSLSWIFTLSLAGGIEREMTIDCLLFFLSTFKPLALPREKSMNCPAMGVIDVGVLTSTIIKCFKRISVLSKGDSAFVLALLAYCLCMDDGLNTARQNAMNKVLPIYERYLMQLSYRISGKFEICKFYREIVKITQNIRWIEGRYCEISKFADSNYLPPLIRETMGNINKPRNDLTQAIITRRNKYEP